MAAAELIAPIGYGAGWLLLGIVLLVVVVIATALIVLARRGSRDRSSATAVERSLGARYLSRIDTIEADFVGGSITAREAHLRLSAVVRSFGHDTSGVNAPVMTLTELRQSPLPEVADAVAEYYPASFERVEPAGIDAALARIEINNGRINALIIARIF